jgi:amino acid permease
MKKSSSVGIAITTFFYASCGLLGYAAFGNNAPGNFLTGFGFYEPYWLIDIGNIFIIIHLVGAYQVNNCFMNKNISTQTFMGRVLN